MAVSTVVNVLVLLAIGADARKAQPPVSSPPAQSLCELAVVGAGAGGLYTAWRLIEAGKFRPESTCVFEMSDRVGGRAYSVRGDDLPPELVSLGVQAADVGAYRASAELHPLVLSLWSHLGIAKGCYDDAAFRTGDCTAECDRPIFRFLRDKSIPHDGWVESPDNSPYCFGPDNDWGASNASRRAWLTPYDWLFGDFAPEFWQANFADLALDPSPEVRWAARRKVVEAAQKARIGGVPLTKTSLMTVSRNGFNSGGVKLTQEDYDFFLDANCSVGEHIITRTSLYHMIVENANYFATGVALRGANFFLPIDPVTEAQIGFATPVEILRDRLSSLGVHFRFRDELVNAGLHRDSERHMLEFASGIVVRPSATILNIPPYSFEKAFGDAQIRGPKARPTLKEVLSGIARPPLLKAYPYYERAFWAELNLTSGRMRTTQELYHSRYHDGFVSCEDDDAKIGCKGILLAQYAQGDRGSPWAETFFPGPIDDPYIQIRRDSSDALQVQYLDEIHDMLIDAHASELKKAGIDPAEIPPPNIALVGAFLGGPVPAAHVREPNNLAPSAFEEAAAEPFPGYAIHLVNEAYGQQGGFMESSLYSAEWVLHHVYGLDKPDFFTEGSVFEGFDADLYYDAVIKYGHGAGKR